MDVAYKLAKTGNKVKEGTVTDFFMAEIKMPNVSIRFEGFIENEKNSGLRSSGHRLSLIFLLPPARASHD